MRSIITLLAFTALSVDQRSTNSPNPSINCCCQCTCFKSHLLLPYSFVTVPTMTATSSCSNLLVRDASNSTGTIYSTRTSTYSSNMDCRWNLTSNGVIELLFYRFVTESSADYVSVYDGDSTSAPLIGRFSGSSLPAPITSSSTKLYVRFTSDGSTQYRGFAARYRGIFFRRQDE